MHVLIDAVGIRGHGGAAVLADLLATLPSARPSWRWTVVLLRRQFREFDDPSVPPSVTIRADRPDSGFIDRLRWVQFGVPRASKALSVDVVLGFANLCSVVPAVPQVLFCQQALPLLREPLPAIEPRMYARAVFLRPWILAGARASAAVIVQTDSMARALRAAVPEIEAGLRVIPSGFSIPEVVPSDAAPQAWHTTSGPSLIYVAHLARHKNHAGLLRALRIVAKRIPAVRLLLTCEPSPRRTAGSSPLMAEIEGLVSRLDLSGNVVWLGTLDRREVFDALAHATLHVFPSLAESFGLPLVESMAAGCPIAASDLPYARNVAAGAAAYFDPLDPTSIAGTVLSVLEDPWRLADLRARGVARRGRFEYPAVAERIAETLEEAVRTNTDRRVGVRRTSDPST